MTLTFFFFFLVGSGALEEEATALDDVEMGVLDLGLGLEAKMSSMEKEVSGSAAAGAVADEDFLPMATSFRRSEGGEMLGDGERQR